MEPNVPLPDASRKVASAAATLGLTIAIRITERSARSAEEAAEAVGAAVGAIVKSLVFRGAVSGRPYLLLVSGDNRVDEASIAATLGEGLVRPNAQDVRGITGFAIGGIPPFGHDTRLETIFDRDLMRHDTVWAAAGTPTAVFPIAPGDLLRATGALLAAVC